MSVKAVLSLLVEALSGPLPVLRDMWCPLCHIELAVSRRFGNAIDYCPKCRGVWLDRGELDKLIERSNIHPDATRHPASPHDDHRYRSRHDEMHGDHHSSSPQDYKKYKKESLLKDLFDF